MSRKRGTQHIRPKAKPKRRYFGYRGRSKKANEVGKNQRHKKAMLARRTRVKQLIRRRKPRLA